MAALNSLNRTILELKRGSAEMFTAPDVTSQSHHFGIETFRNRSGSIADLPLNRTILELKHRIGVEYKAEYLASQSHHFGIET